MSYESVRAALQAAIDNAATAEPRDGTAFGVDKDLAERVLERLERAKAALDAGYSSTQASDPTYNARLAEYMDSRQRRYTAAARALRRLMELIIAAAPDDPANPGHKADPEVERLDPATPIPFDTLQYYGPIIRLARRYGIAAEVLEAANVLLQQFTNSYYAKPPTKRAMPILYHRDHRDAYSAALLAATQFVAYLEDP